MNIPELTDEQISKAKELWNAMNKEMEEQGCAFAMIMTMAV